MRMRTLLACVHLVNFLIGISATGYILISSSGYLENWQVSLYVYYLLLGFCGVAIALWVVVDGRHIGSCVVEVRDLERRIVDLERQIDRIRTVKLGRVR